MLVSPAHCSTCKTERDTMDDVTFQSDTVLSDIHLHVPSKRHLMVRLNAVGQPVFLSYFKLLLDKTNWNSEKKEEKCQHEGMRPQEMYAERLHAEDCSDDQHIPNHHEKKRSALKEIAPLLDKDGDFEVVRKPLQVEAKSEYCSRNRVCPIILSKGDDSLGEDEREEMSPDIIKIEHTMATPLEDVGKQVWRGAFLLADYILSEPDLFKDCTVLELGGGTGIVSIIMAKVAKSIYCTDVGDDLLDMCKRNIALNKYHIEPAGSTVKVRVLDWQEDEFSTDPVNPYCWSEQEIVELHNLTTVILAADVFYDDYLTTAFFKTLCRITHNLKNPSTIYLSIEKRLNFSLRHMDVACEAYNHFRDALNDLVNSKDGKISYTVEPVQLSFPQHLVYERVEQLELWKIIADVASERNGTSGDPTKS